MKTACATLLSLWLAMAQLWLAPTAVPAAGGSAGNSPAVAESCCEGPRAHHCVCCVEPAARSAAPRPAVPAPDDARLLSAATPAVPPMALWTLPNPAASVCGSGWQAAPAAPQGNPLFLRLGALLI